MLIYAEIPFFTDGQGKVVRVRRIFETVDLGTILRFMGPVNAKTESPDSIDGFSNDF